MKMLDELREILPEGNFKKQPDGKKFRTQRTVKSAVYLPVYKFTFYVYAAEWFIWQFTLSELPFLMENLSKIKVEKPT